MYLFKKNIRAFNMKVLVSGPYMYMGNDKNSETHELGTIFSSSFSGVLSF